MEIIAHYPHVSLNHPYPYPCPGPYQSFVRLNKKVSPVLTAQQFFIHQPQNLYFFVGKERLEVAAEAGEKGWQIAGCSEKRFKVYKFQLPFRINATLTVLLCGILTQFVINYDYGRIQQESIW